MDLNTVVTINREINKIYNELDSIKNDIKELKSESNIENNAVPFKTFLKEKRLKILYKAKHILTFLCIKDRINEIDESHYKSIQPKLEERDEFVTFELSKYKNTSELYNDIEKEIDNIEKYFSERNEIEDKEEIDEEYKLKESEIKEKVFRLTINEEDSIFLCKALDCLSDRAYNKMENYYGKKIIISRNLKEYMKNSINYCIIKKKYKKLL